jgi:hypothetical protein
MRVEDFEKYKNVPIDEIDESELVDIRTIEVRMDLPPKERMEDVLRKIKNPYFFKVGKFVVKSTFDEDGYTIGECLKALLML